MQIRSSPIWAKLPFGKHQAGLAATIVGLIFFFLLVLAGAYHEAGMLAFTLGCWLASLSLIIVGLALKRS